MRQMCLQICSNFSFMSRKVKVSGTAFEQLLCVMSTSPFLLGFSESVRGTCENVLYSVEIFLPLVGEALSLIQQIYSGNKALPVQSYYLHFIGLSMQEQQLTRCVCAQDFREAARMLMKKEAFEYIDSGSEEEKTLNENRSSFHRLMIVPRVLTSSSTTDLTTSLFGRKLSLPFGFAPWAMNTLSHPQGEVVPALVAKKNNMIFSLSTLSTRSYSEVVEANGEGMRMMQMYISNDWSLTETQVRLAEKYGFSALVITVDAQVLGIRKREVKAVLDTSNLSFPVLQEIQKCSGSMRQYTDRKALLANRDLSMTWQTIRKIRSLSKLKIVLKGIMHPKDAVIALDYCDAIWVSNHGGRQLDGISSTINILPLIKAAVGDRIPLLIDGGVRTGNDIYKCLALGANYVLVARPLAYSLVFGQEGVTKLVRILEDELHRVLTLVGCKSLKDVRPESVVPEPTL